MLFLFLANRKIRERVWMINQLRQLGYLSNLMKLVKLIVQQILKKALLQLL